MPTRRLCAAHARAERRVCDRLAVPIYRRRSHDDADLHGKRSADSDGCLDVVQFKAAPNVAGSFQIQVQALTIDTDPNTGISVQAISGTVTLTPPRIAPVADPVTLAVDAPAVGRYGDSAGHPRDQCRSPETFIVTLNGFRPAQNSLRRCRIDGNRWQRFDRKFQFINTADAYPALEQQRGYSAAVSAVSVDTSGGLDRHIRYRPCHW